MASKTFALLLALAPLAFAPVAYADDLPEAPEKKLVNTVCSGCHDLGTAIGVKRTPAGWKEIVEQMADRGARASDEELAAITAYLAKYFGVPQKIERSGK